jgi:hypothetical protein
MPEEALPRTLYEGTANEEKILVDEYLGDDKKMKINQKVTVVRPRDPNNNTSGVISGIYSKHVPANSLEHEIYYEVTFKDGRSALYLEENVKIVAGGGRRKLRKLRKSRKSKKARKTRRRH